MDTHQLLELLDAGPVIAAVKDPAGLAQALDSDVSVLFLLYGDTVSYTHRDVYKRQSHSAGRSPSRRPFNSRSSSILGIPF